MSAPEAVTRPRLGGLLRGFAGVVAQAASAVGLEGVAGALEEAAEQRAVAFDEQLAGAGEDAGAGDASDARERFRRGARRSLSMSRRMRFEAEEDAVEGLHFSRTGRQQQLKTEAVLFAAEAAEARAAAEPREVPTAALEAAARRGFGRMVVPRAAGGLGLGCDAAACVFEELGGADLPLAGLLAAHNAAAHLLAEYGSGSQALTRMLRQHVAPLSSLAALAVSESPAGSDPRAITTFAEKDISGQFSTLNGSKAWVAGGASAEVFLVLARTGVTVAKGMTLFAITKSTPGVTVGRPAALRGWRSAPVAPLQLKGVVVRQENVLGREGQGAELLDSAGDLQRVWLAAAAVACGEAALAAAVEAVADDPLTMLYGNSLERQAHQTDLARVRTRLQAARLMVRAAAQQLDCRASTASADAATAKVYALRAAQEAAACASRVGGWGALESERPHHSALQDLQAADFVAGPLDSLYGKIFAEMYRLCTL
ncbi:hypothetical protein HYH03_012869 [Edaphochlamys debaryana]|uniref:Acyl-CoA dehydrogenase n=1 Tax=Edaphochlamys debaryana TaxID=47281 RepID=A0A835XRW3_9CHLO|nr:hypothetical protein HYH03_012869 [Edaphochlamys debaryana]|eukprot:KAG2488550.1 hypothetical protein HYH03_012869 [Edaphochlamys debaryana]